MNHFSMQAPGTAQQRTVARPYTVSEKPKKRCGLIPIRPETQHQIRIAGKAQLVTAKDRRAFPEAAGKLFCLHPACAERFHDTFEQLMRAHDPQTELERRQEVHPYAFWSNDPCNAHPEPGCDACKKASADATRAARAKDKDAHEQAVPCAEHAGGAIGLLTPTDPHAPSS
jgi:hypothetical protein